MRNLRAERKSKLILCLFNTTNSSFSFDEYKISKKVLAEVLKVEKIDINISVNISIVGSKKIRTLNKIKRKIDRVTDVLSFPNISFENPSDIKTLIKNTKNNALFFDYTTNSYFLGDIVICYNKVIEQSKKYNHSIMREYCFLLTHSMLHLLGYDHIKINDEKFMIEKQNNILKNLKILR